MIQKIHPELNKLYFINIYSLFHILEGNGGIEVDFKNYHDWKDKLIILEKGQYIQFLSENFVDTQYKNHSSNKMNFSVNTLSKKIKDKLKKTLGQLIRQELITTAIILLQTNAKIKHRAVMLNERRKVVRLFES